MTWKKKLGSPDSKGRRPKRNLEVPDNSVLFFPLAELTAYEARGFCKEPEYRDPDGFVLMLAVALNDLKDLFCWLHLTYELRPEQVPGVLDRHRGQCSGMENHVLRLLCGWLQEVSRMFVDGKTAGARGHPLFVALMEKMPGRVRRNLDDLLNLHASPELRRLLGNIRSHGTFHYTQTNPLIEGYIAHFSKEGKASEFPLASYGTALEDSRFYFADAAIVEMCSRETEKISNPMPRLFESFKSGREALAYIIYTYFELRGFRAFPYSTLQ